jgi:hypothetical protein
VKERAGEDIKKDVLHLQQLSRWCYLSLGWEIQKGQAPPQNTNLSHFTDKDIV